MFKLTCKETAQLTSESLDHRLPFFKRLAVRLHLKICKLCEDYREQMLLVRNILQRGKQRMMEDAPPDAPLPDEARERIRRCLREKIS